MGFLLGYLVGGVVTIFLVAIGMVRNTIGVLKIDKSDPKKDKYCIVITNKNIDALSERRFAYLRIDAKADLSQEKQTP